MEASAQGWLSPELWLPIMRDGAFYILITLFVVGFVLSWLKKNGNIVLGDEAKQKIEIASLQQQIKRLEDEVKNERALCTERMNELRKDLDQALAELAKIRGGGQG